MTEAGNCMLKIYLWFENNVSKLTKLKKVKCRFEHVQFTKGAQHKECSTQRMLKKRNDLQYLNKVCFVLLILQMLFT